MSFNGPLGIKDKFAAPLAMMAVALVAADWQQTGLAVGNTPCVYSANVDGSLQKGNCSVGHNSW